MSLQSVLNYLQASSEYKFLEEQVKKNKTNHIYGVTGSQKSILATLLLKIQKKPLLYIAESVLRGKEIFDDFCNLFATHEVQFFPALDSLPFEVLAQSHETWYQRLEVLEGFNRKTKVVVTTWEALVKLNATASFSKALVNLAVGQRLT